jgi:hypothetical protein
MEGDPQGSVHEGGVFEVLDRPSQQIIRMSRRFLRNTALTQHFDDFI